MWSKKRLFWVLVGLSVLLYIPTWFNGFVWDDEEQIVNNPFVQSVAGVGAIFSGSTFGGGGAALPSGGYYKPLMSVWYLMNHLFFGEWAGGYHLSQSVVHGLNAGLLFLILSELLRKRKVAFGAALVWLIHPGNVESVAYAASAQEVLASFFGLAAVWLVMVRKRWRMDEISVLFGAVGLCFLSLLSKEAGVVFPLVIGLYLTLVERRNDLGRFFGLMLVPMVLLYAVLRFGVANVHVEPNLIIPVAQLSFGERMLTVVETLWQHVRVIFWPLHLYIGHHQVVTDISASWWVKLVVLVGLLGTLVGVTVKIQNSSVKAYKSKVELWRLAWFFLLWLIVAIGIVSNVYPLDMTYAERWSYMPMLAGFSWLAVIGEEFRIANSEYRMKRNKILYSLFFILLLLLVGRTVVRELDWHDGLRLYGHDIAYAVDSFDLENNYGVELMRAGRMEEAKIHFERSMALSPRWWTPPNNLGVVYQRLGETERAEELYRTSIENGDYFLAYENLATVLAVEGNASESAQVIEAGLKRFPYNQTLRQVALWLTQNSSGSGEIVD